MKKINSMLKGIKNMPLANYGMKMLFIPCLIAVLSLSAFKGKEIQKASTPSFQHADGTAMFTDPYVWTTVEVVFTDLDGIEYQNVWVDFFDEAHSPVTVYDLTLNYQLAIYPGTYTENQSQVLSGNSFFLLENTEIYSIPASYTGSSTYFYMYNLLPGTGYIPF